MKTNKRAVSFFVTIILLGALLLLSCCTYGLNRVMESYHFTAISPPQSNWENGSVVEIDPQFPNAPILRAMPSMVPVSILNITHDAPSVSQSHDEKLDLSLGISIPDKVKAGLTAKGVHKYSVVTEGNVITSVPLDSYAIDTFPKIAEKFGSKWAPAIKDKNLYYFYEIWLTKKLTYKFYDANDIALGITVPIQIPFDLSPGWKSTDDGSLVFEGPSSICLGYRARPIRIEKTGKVAGKGIIGTRRITAISKDASENRDDKQ